MLMSQAMACKGIHNLATRLASNFLAHQDRQQMDGNISPTSFMYKLLTFCGPLLSKPETSYSILKTAATVNRLSFMFYNLPFLFIEHLYLGKKICLTIILM